MSAHVYRPARSGYRRGNPILTLDELHEAAATQYAEMPILWSAWPHDDLPWATTSSDSFVDLHAPFRLPVLPWVADLWALVTAHDAEIGIEDGATMLYSASGVETFGLRLGVTPGDAGSTRTDHGLVWRRRPGSASEGEVYGVSLLMLPLSTLPEGL